MDNLPSSPFMPDEAVSVLRDTNNPAMEARATFPWLNSARFAACQPFILREEGGFSNTKGDNGGPTNDGIIQREYDGYRRKIGLPLQSVKMISVDEYSEIYWENYWTPHCPMLPAGVDLMFYNICVNGGPFRAIELLQKSMFIESDGVWGKDTDKAVKLISPRSDINGYALATHAWYQSLANAVPHDRQFLSDWLGRTERCRQLALTMVKT